MKKSVITNFLLLISFFTILNNIYANTHFFTGLPITDNGWTDLHSMFNNPLQYSDSRIVYVSTSGNDNTARDYSPNDLEINGDPFNPAGPVLSYASLEAAYGRLRNGHADIMLLNRGDIWTEDLPLWKKSGKSINERMILGAYGSQTLPRPKIGKYRDYYGKNHPQHAYSYNIIISIEFQSLRRTIGGSHMLIEDCAIFKGKSTGMTLQGYGMEIENATLRRSVISERYPSADNSSHCQGIYIEYTKNVLLEENIFDHNGWTTGPEGGGPTIFNHNTYLSAANKNTIMRYNISTRSSSKGYQPGGGGIIYANLSFQDPIGIESSRDEKWNIGIKSFIKSNVIISPMDPKSSSQTNWGLRMCNVGESIVEDNIFANNPNPINSIAIYLDPNERYGEQMRIQNVIIKNNIIHNWHGPIYIEGDTPQIENIEIVGNRIHEDRNNVLINVKGDTINQINSSQNIFFSERDIDQWFRYKRNSMDLTSWRDFVADTGSYSSATRTTEENTIPDYLHMINEPSDLKSFYQKLQNQRKGNWDTRYSAIAIINFIRKSFEKDAIYHTYDSAY